MACDESYGNGWRGKVYIAGLGLATDSRGLHCLSTEWISFTCLIPTALA